MILCVTPNPALDRTLVVSGFTAGKIFRASSSLSAPGGKGINVARAARILGGKSLCAGFLGGSPGRYVAELAEQEGIPAEWTWIQGDTRACTIIANPDTGEATVLNEQGPTVTAQDWERLQADVLRQASTAQVVCLSGSLPPGSPTQAYLALITSLQQTAKPVWVDTSGAALHAARLLSDISIKVNGDEAGEILGKQITDPASALSAAQELRQAGPQCVVLTLGAQGAVMAHPAGQWWAKPPTLKVIDSVGSGDSFLAGLVTSFVAGLSPSEALRRAVAAGAANALSVGGGSFPLSDFNRILSQTALQAL